MKGTNWAHGSQGGRGGAGRQLTSIALRRVRRGVNRFGWSFVAMFAVVIVGKGALTRIVDSAKAHEEGTVRPTSSSIAEVKKASIANSNPASGAEAAVVPGIVDVPKADAAQPEVSTAPSSDERKGDRKDARTGSGRKLSNDWSSSN